MLKTTELLKCSALMGVLAAGGNEAQMKAAEEYAVHLGLAFQIQDDILDVTATTEELGKTPGKDEREGKATFVSLYGIDKCRKIVDKETELSKEAIRPVFNDTSALCALADELACRKH